MTWFMWFWALLLAGAIAAGVLTIKKVPHEGKGFLTGRGYSEAGKHFSKRH